MRIRIIIGSAVWAAALLSLLLHPADAHAAPQAESAVVNRIRLDDRTPPLKSGDHSPARSVAPGAPDTAT